MLAVARRRTAQAIVLACVLVLLACAPPPRLTSGLTPPDPPPPPRRKPYFQSVAGTPGESPAVVALQPRLHDVERGDTVFRISRAYGVPIRNLIDHNGLTPPYVLRPGQRLAIPALRLHRVAPGDTVYGISRRYGLDMRELVRLNGITQPFTIALDQRLVLPSESPAVKKSDLAVAEAAPAKAAAGAAPPVPLQAPDRASIPRRKPGAQVAAAPPPVFRGPIPNPPPRAASSFLWPLQGRVSLGFGPKRGGLHNDGININAPTGSPILAAENGVVAYAGNELRGFGNLLLIKHADGWVTAYAHAQQLLVGRGQTVKRGQTIARVGSSGNVSAPQLHFEIRKGSRAVDPLRHLSRRTAAAS